MAAITHCSDLFIVVQIQWHSAAFVAPRALSEAVSEAVTSDFLIPSTHFFFWHINGPHCDQSAVLLLTGSLSADTHQENAP